ncbi:hypothetical protein HPB47_020347 [Ixodes persulcatus]|uniref:Uncharacterized protein n=1 Tax=Ixodes persulcatus TaxID=34615 RepID=A0AC60QIB1_IXOPE|nr:hypothetical protein HPB47_020347 [Ixodes persulcatus]
MARMSGNSISARVGAIRALSKAGRHTPRVPVNLVEGSKEHGATIVHEGQGDDACPTSSNAAFSDARFLVRRAICVRHSDIENSPMPPRPPKNLPRKVASGMHRLYSHKQRLHTISTGSLARRQRQPLPIVVRYDHFSDERPNVNRQQEQRPSRRATTVATGRNLTNPDAGMSRRL